MLYVNTPYSSDHGSALAQPVRNSRPRLFSGYDAERHPDTPNDAASNAHHVIPDTPPEIITIPDGLAPERLFHKQDVEHDVAQEYFN